MRIDRWPRAALALALAFSGASAAAETPSAPGPAASADPAKIYQDRCDFCHGGGLAPVILGRALAADAVRTIARSGRGDMPAFAEKDLSEADLAALADWISKSKAPEAGAAK